jgi:trigger factor
MQVSVESPSKLERRITVSVPSTELDNVVEKKITQLAKTAKVKGFRTGNVPVAHIKKMYGASVRQEAISDLIQSSLYAALNQEKLNPVGPPSVEPTNLNPGQPIEYVATFEVLPELENVNFNLTDLEKQVSSIEDADIDKVVERLSEQHIKWNKVDRAAQDKDQVVIDFKGSIDGEFFAGGDAHDYPIVLGSKSMIPGFEEGIVGMKAGDEKKIQVTFPEKYFAKEMAGKVAEFAIKAPKVSESQLPEMNEEMIKQFGIQSGKLDELRAEIRKNLEREVDRLVTTKMKNKVFDALIDQNPMDVPNALIEQEAKRIHDEVHPNHKGHDHQHSDEENEQFNQAAKRNVILGILIGEFVKKHELKADSKRVEAHLTSLAAAYENPSEVVKWYSSDRKRLAEIEMLILEEQLIEKLLENVKVTEKKLNYADLMAS